jgi:mannose-6-phosphate isomerase-like protein (cupin superfamily)
MNQVVRESGGIHFKSEEDEARLIVSGEDTGGQYSLLDWTVAPELEATGPDTPDYGVHLHRQCEETFLIISGSLEFLIGDEIVVLGGNDFVRVPAGVPHGYRNSSGETVRMLVGFVPAGLEELFVRYRTDQDTIPKEGFVAEATRRFASEFGLPSPAK